MGLIAITASCTQGRSMTPSHRCHSVSARAGSGAPGLASSETGRADRDRPRSIACGSTRAHRQARQSARCRLSTEPDARPMRFYRLARTDKQLRHQKPVDQIEAVIPRSRIKESLFELSDAMSKQVRRIDHQIREIAQRHAENPIRPDWREIDLHSSGSAGRFRRRAYFMQTGDKTSTGDGRRSLDRDLWPH